MIYRLQLTIPGRVIQELITQIKEGSSQGLSNGVVEGCVKGHRVRRVENSAKRLGQL